jgi:adenosine deaminase
MTQKLKMGVKVSLKTKNKGSVLISFNNIEEYNKIIKKLTSDK